MIVVMGGVVGVHRHVDPHAAHPDESTRAVRRWCGEARRNAAFFPWERRGGLFRRLGLYRLGPLAIAFCLIGLLVLVVVRERRQAGVRRTRAPLLDVRQAVDAYLADHKGQCPDSFAALADYGAFGDAEGCLGPSAHADLPGSEPGEAYRLISAGPDGIAGRPGPHRIDDKENQNDAFEETDQGETARAPSDGGRDAVEVMIVVAIMALLSGGVAVVVIPKLKEAQVSTRRRARR